MRRQTLALYFLNKAHRLTNSDRALSRFIHFVTGKNEHNIRKVLLQPTGGSKTSHIAKTTLLADLHYIREYFKDMGDLTTVKHVDEAIDIVENH
jgi:hypothetical protein